MTSHSDKSDSWQYEGSPSAVGWWATLTCWEMSEGQFPGAHFWDGAKWVDTSESLLATRDPVAAYWPGDCTSAEEARALAYSHDPEC